MATLWSLRRNGHRNHTEFDLLGTQLAELIGEGYGARRNLEAIQNLRHVATLKPGDPESRHVATQQCARLLWWLDQLVWGADQACCLVYGVDPMVDESDVAPSGCYSLDGRWLTGDSSEFADAWVLAQSLRSYLERETEHGIATSEALSCEISPADFINWCEDENIDTSYLRLIRTLIGAGKEALIGRLPLTSVQIFSPAKP